MHKFYALFNLVCLSHTTQYAAYCALCNVFGFKTVSLVGECYEDPGLFSAESGNLWVGFFP